MPEIFREKNPLAKVENRVGIYGTGEKAGQFFAEYKGNIGEIKTQLYFLDSYVHPREKKYMGFKIFNINDIWKLPLDYIIITSVKYGQEMRKNIQERYGDKFKILLLKSNMQLEE